MNSPVNPDPVSDSPPSGQPVQAGLRKASLFLKILWVVAVSVTTIPLVQALAKLLGGRGVGQADLLAASVGGGALVAFVIAGLRRNWPANWESWGLLGSVLCGTVVFGLLMNRRGEMPNMDKAVLGHARQLAAAANQYFLEYGGTTVDRVNLIGATNYIKALNVVAGEAYPSAYTQGVTVTITGIAGLRTITYYEP